MNMRKKFLYLIVGLAIIICSLNGCTNSKDAETIQNLTHELAQSNDSLAEKQLEFNETSEKLDKTLIELEEAEKRIIELEKMLEKAEQRIIELEKTLADFEKSYVAPENPDVPASNGGNQSQSQSQSQAGQGQSQGQSQAQSQADKDMAVIQGNQGGAGGGYNLDIGNGLKEGGGSTGQTESGGGFDHSGF